MDLPPPGLIPDFDLSCSIRPTHDPAREQVADRRCADDACLFTTRREPARLHEYHLRKGDGRWYVTSVLSVCDDGKVETVR